jgi:hypothetical protein
MLKVNANWNSTAAEKRILKASKEGLADALEFILQESNKKVPLDEGTLLRSGNVDINEDLKKNYEGSVYYDTKYVIRLHEHPEYRFQNRRMGKWLEITVNTVKSKIIIYLQNKMKNALK